MVFTGMIFSSIKAEEQLGKTDLVGTCQQRNYQELSESPTLS